MKIHNNQIIQSVIFQPVLKAASPLRGARDLLSSAVDSPPGICQRFFNWLRGLWNQICSCGKSQSVQPPTPPPAAAPDQRINAEEVPVRQAREAAGRLVAAADRLGQIERRQEQQPPANQFWNAMHQAGQVFERRPPDNNLRAEEEQPPVDQPARRPPDIDVAAAMMRAHQEWLAQNADNHHRAEEQPDASDDDEEPSVDQPARRPPGLAEAAAMIRGQQELMARNFDHALPADNNRRAQERRIRLQDQPANEEELARLRAEVENFGNQELARVQALEDVIQERRRQVHAAEPVQGLADFRAGLQNLVREREAQDPAFRAEQENLRRERAEQEEAYEAGMANVRDRGAQNVRAAQEQVIQGRLRRLAAHDNLMRERERQVAQNRQAGEQNIARIDGEMHALEGRIGQLLEQ